NWLAQQDAKPVVGLAEDDLQCRNRRARLLHERPKLLLVDRGPGADFFLPPRYSHELLLGAQVVARALEPLPYPPRFDGVRYHVGQQRHQSVIIVLYRSVQVGSRRLDISADAAPEIELPT